MSRSSSSTSSGARPSSSSLMEAWWISLRRLRLASSRGAAFTSSSSWRIMLPIRITLAGCSTRSVMARSSPSPSPSPSSSLRTTSSADAGTCPIGCPVRADDDDGRLLLGLVPGSVLLLGHASNLATGGSPQGGAVPGDEQALAVEEIARYLWRRSRLSVEPEECSTNPLRPWSAGHRTLLTHSLRGARDSSKQKVRTTKNQLAGDASRRLGDEAAGTGRGERSIGSVTSTGQTKGPWDSYSRGPFTYFRPLEPPGLRSSAGSSRCARRTPSARAPRPPGPAAASCRRRPAPSRRRPAARRARRRPRRSRPSRSAGRARSVVATIAPRLRSSALMSSSALVPPCIPMITSRPSVASAVTLRSR